MARAATGSPAHDRPRRGRDDSGVSFVELVVALGLVGLMAVAVAPLVMLGTELSAASQEATELTVAAADRLETLTALSFDDPALAAGGSVAASVDGYSDDPLTGDDDRYVRWEITDVSPILKRIRLVAGSRLALHGPAREVTIETYRADL